jgi:hypothetical protein
VDGLPQAPGAGHHVGGVNVDVVVVDVVVDVVDVVVVVCCLFVVAVSATEKSTYTEQTEM